MQTAALPAATRPQMSPFVIGIAGASGSGKTRIASDIKTRFEGCGRTATVVSADWFYRAPVPASVTDFFKTRGTKGARQVIEQLKTSRSIMRAAAGPSLINALETQLDVESGAFNWDEPAALDLEALVKAIATLRRGKIVRVDEFNFRTRQRDLTRQIEPADMVLVEGLFVLASPELEALLDYKIFVHASQPTIWARKLARDAGDDRGGHGESYLRTQFEQAWKMYVLHVAPTRLHPGVQVVDNDDDACWEALIEAVCREVIRVEQRRRLVLPCIHLGTVVALFGVAIVVARVMRRIR